MLDVNLRADVALVLSTFHATLPHLRAVRWLGGSWQLVGWAVGSWSVGSWSVGSWVVGSWSVGSWVISTWAVGSGAGAVHVPLNAARGAVVGQMAIGWLVCVSWLCRFRNGGRQGREGGIRERERERGREREGGRVGGRERGRV